MDEDVEETYDMPWAEIPEDTSVAFPYELVEIDMKGPEISALDHDHWEKLTFTELKDPEYQHVASGRIDWTIDHLNGTRESPNKAAIMRSTTVHVGGFDWRIKLFPRGNNTDYLSIYIECCSFVSPPSDQPQKQAALQHTPIPLMNGKKLPKRHLATAQISVVLYNPAEPRVHKHQTASHKFWKDNSDWGWTRFVPRYDMWKRLHGQRQALVRSDTIAMSAYIRVIDDSTGCYSEKVLENMDSAALTGLHPMRDPGIYPRPETGTLFVSILATWLLYRPFRNLLYDCRSSDWFNRDGPRSKRLLHALQCVLYDLRRPITGDHDMVVSVVEVVQALQYYGFDTALPYDTALLIERIYFILSEEVRKTPLEAKLHAIFRAASQPEDATTALSPVQRVDVAKQSDLQTVVNAGDLDTPQFLQLELKRHRFDPQAQKWERNTDYLKLPDNLTVKDQQYVLFGFITHKGDLRAGSARPILRPGGPGTKWFTYEKVLNHDRATCVTQRAAEAAAGNGASKNSELAHVVLYVRDDVRDVAFQDHPETAWDDLPSDKEPGTEDASFKVDERVQLAVFDSRGVVDHEGHGCFRLEDLVGATPSKYIKMPNIGIGPAIPALAKMIGLQSEIKDVRQVNAWIADIWGKAEGIPHLYPLLPDETLADALRRPQVYRRIRGFERGLPDPRLRRYYLWVHITPLEHLPNKEEVALPKPPGSTALTTQEDAGEGPSVALRGAPVPPDPPLPVPVSEDIAAGQTAGQDITSEVQMIAEAGDAENVTPDDRHRTEDSPSEGTPTSTTSTSDPSSEEHDDSPGSPRRVGTSRDTRRARRTMRNPSCTSNLYFILKTYDPRTMKLTVQGSYMLPGKKSLYKAIRKILDIESPKPGLSLWEEKSWAVKRVARGCTLEDAYTDETCLVFIAQIDPPSSEQAAYPAGIDGKTDMVTNTDGIIDVEKYFECLATVRTSPWTADGTQTIDYMSRPYYKGPMRFGLYHGTAPADMSIYDDGSMYTGTYHHGHRHGQGHLIYPNGDTYTGSWHSDSRHGYGTFTESVSGNSYSGYWQHDKRHGEGVTIWKKAEYSEKLCRICWEGKADAVFVPCGHVVTCLTCARQVDTCPFCHVTVREAIRVYLLI